MNIEPSFRNGGVVQTAGHVTGTVVSYSASNHLSYYVVSYGPDGSCSYMFEGGSPDEVSVWLAAVGLKISGGNRSGIGTFWLTEEEKECAT